ncbi:hypothetical protein D3C87_574300 [compost metagenome]
MDNIQIGDWIIGKRDGAMVTGWVEKIADEISMVYVIESDDKHNIGKSIFLLNKKLKKLKDSDFVYDKASVLNMIDISLMIGNKQEFLHFTDMLRGFNLAEVQRAV